MPTVSYATKDWGTSDDIDQFRRSFAAFCNRVAQLSDANAPPGANAANGHFRDRMLDDPELASLVPPRGEADDPEAAAIFQILSTFEQGIRSSFNPENYPSSWAKSGDLAIKALDTLKDQIQGVVSAIGAVAALDAAAIAAVAASIKALVDKINSSGIKFDGQHANGWIQKNMKSTATAASAAITPHVAGAGDPLAKKLAEAIKQIADQIVAIPDFENKPWLYGEWQVRFQAIMAAGAVTLQALKAPAPAAAPAAAAVAH